MTWTFWHWLVLAGSLGATAATVLMESNRYLLVQCAFYALVAALYFTGALP